MRNVTEINAILIECVNGIALHILVICFSTLYKHH